MDFDFFDWDLDLDIDWGDAWDAGVELWDDNKDWIVPAGKTLYGAYQEDKKGDEYRERRKPHQDYMDKVIKQQSAYYDPKAVEAGVAEDLKRKAGMLSSQYRRADMLGNAGALSKGTIGSSTFGRQRAMRDAARDNTWANTIVPGAYNQYFNRGSQYGNANTQVAGLFTKQPIMQPLYEASEVNPYLSAAGDVFNYITNGSGNV